MNKKFFDEMKDLSEMKTNEKPPVEPWLLPASSELLTEVTHLVGFLQSRLETLETNSNDKAALMVRSKISQLLKWRETSNKVIRLREYENFVDALQLQSERMEIRETEFQGKRVKVFVIPSSFEPEIDIDSEEKIPFCTVSTGFILCKCLRKVRSQKESRDVYKAIKCDFDLGSNFIIRVSPEEKFVLKRVGKYKNSEIYNSRLRREFKVQDFLTQLNHKGINPLYSFHEDESSMFSISYSAGETDLLDHLSGLLNAGKRMSEEEVSKAFYDAVEGLLVSHNLGIAHRDISLENIVLREVLSSEGSMIKSELIDWGHSCSASSSGFVKHEGRIGKQRYFAPELAVRTENYDPFKTDVFALGVCLFSCFVGQMPFENLEDSRAELLSRGVRTLLSALDKTDLVSDEGLDLLQKCLEWDPEKRATLAEVFNHRFFKKYI